MDQLVVILFKDLLEGLAVLHLGLDRGEQAQGLDREDRHHRHDADHPEAISHDRRTRGIELFGVGDEHREEKARSHRTGGDPSRVDGDADVDPRDEIGKNQSEQEQRNREIQIRDSVLRAENVQDNGDPDGQAKEDVDHDFRDNPVADLGDVVGEDFDRRFRQHRDRAEQEADEKEQGEIARVGEIDSVLGSDGDEPGFGPHQEENEPEEDVNQADENGEHFLFREFEEEIENEEKHNDRGNGNRNVLQRGEEIGEIERGDAGIAIDAGEKGLAGQDVLDLFDPTRILQHDGKHHHRKNRPQRAKAGVAEGIAAGGIADAPGDGDAYRDDEGDRDDPGRDSSRIKDDGEKALIREQREGEGEQITDCEPIFQRLIENDADQGDEHEYPHPKGGDHDKGPIRPIRGDAGGQNGEVGLGQSGEHPHQESNEKQQPNGFLLRQSGADDVSDFDKAFFNPEVEQSGPEDQRDGGYKQRSHDGAELAAALL